MPDAADLDDLLDENDDELAEGDDREDRDNAVAAIIAALALSLTALLIQWRDQKRDPGELFDHAQPELFGEIKRAFQVGERGWPSNPVAEQAATQAAEAYAGDAVRAMAPYLEGLGADLATMSDDAIAARADLYAGAAWPSYQAGRVEGAVSARSAANANLPPAKAGWQIMARWVKDQLETSCDDCVALDGEEWPVDEVPYFPGDGNTQCLSNCRCFLSMVASREEMAA